MVTRPINKDLNYYIKYAIDNEIKVDVAERITFGFCAIRWENTNNIYINRRIKNPFRIFFEGGDYDVVRICEQYKTGKYKIIENEITVKGEKYYTVDLLKKLIQACIEHRDNINLMSKELSTYAKDLEAAAEEMKR